MKSFSTLCAALFLLLVTYKALSQGRVVTGSVRDGKDNSPLIGATIAATGTTAATSADARGNFTLNVPATASTLTISLIGYLSRQIPITSGPLQIRLLTGTNTLNDVVVIGYGTARRRDVTGSVATVTARSFNQGPSVTPEQLITGKVAGVQVTSNSGEPGAGSTIRIRGGASLNASNDPLIVIDGVPVSNTAIAGSSNPLSSINPNDIESFNILKDASATAIYGSRASNGVIIITTKKGRSEDFHLNFSTQNTYSKRYTSVSVLSAGQFRQLVTQNGAPQQVALLGTASTNWQNAIFQGAYGTDNNISFSGGLKALPYRLSLGYTDQDGILKTSNYKRTTVALNLNKFVLNQSLRFDINLKGTYSESRFADAGAIGAAVNFDPTQPITSGNANYGGYYEWQQNSIPNTLATRNPVGLLEERDNRGKTSRSIGNIQLTYIFPFLKDLKLNANLGYDVSRGSGTDYTPASAAAFYNQKGFFRKYNQTNLNYVSDYYLNYTKNLASIHSRIDATAGYTYQFFSFFNLGEQTYAADATTAIGGSLTLPSKPEYYIESQFGRLNYSFYDKYLLTATFRRDGSSRFSPKNRYGNFPSASIAWRINQENFLKNSKVVSDLKLRVGYGVTGQQELFVPGGAANTPYFPYLARYTFSNNSARYQFGNTYYTTLRPEAYDENIKWEQTATSNAGLDYGFLNGRISGAIDFFYKKTSGLLSNIPLPEGSNLSNFITTNVGNLNSKGFEFSVNAQIIKTKDVTWNAGYNISENDIRITNLSKVHLSNSPPVANIAYPISGGVGSYIEYNQVGYTPNSYYVYKQVYNQNGKPLEGVYADLNKNGAFDANDKYLYQSPHNKYFMGLNSSVTYKHFDLGFSLRANIGNYLYNNFAATTGAYSGFQFPNYLGNLSSSVLKTGFAGYQYFSDYYVENASFLRMDYINLGYNFPAFLHGKGTLRLTLNVTNVFLITKYTGLDPEVQSGVDNNFYPRPRIFSLGLNLGL